MDKLIEILKNYAQDVDFATEDKLIENNIIDSLDVVSLVIDLNEAFDIKITAKDLVPENFNSAKAIFDLISKLQGE